MKVFLFSVIILAICIVFLCVNIIFKRKGEFPKTHVSANKAMSERGIGCVQSQDRMARRKNRLAIKER